MFDFNKNKWLKKIFLNFFERYYILLFCEMHQIKISIGIALKVTLVFNASGCAVVFFCSLQDAEFLFYVPKLEEISDCSIY